MAAIIDSTLCVYAIQVAEDQNNMIASGICTLCDIDSNSERLNVSFDAVGVNSRTTQIISNHV
jgi:predicted Zn-dependent protease